MKGFLIFCLLLAVVTAIPLKDNKTKKYSPRKQTRQDAVAPPAKPRTKSAAPLGNLNMLYYILHLHTIAQPCIN